jgi:glycogen synthase
LLCDVRLLLFAVIFQVIFTIHNMNYGQKKIAEAAEWSQKFTTVSPTYAFEVRSVAVWITVQLRLIHNVRGVLFCHA